MERILVAEDSFALANLLEFVLKTAGFDVTLQRTGTAALNEAQKVEFDLILLDQQMPGLTGVEVVEGFRESGPNQHTTTFLCTAKTHELDLQYIKNDLRVREVFHKPFSPKDLVEDLKVARHELAANQG